MTEFLAVDADLEALLWRHVFDLDLVQRASARMLPTDDSTRWRLAEPRRPLQRATMF